MVSFVTRAAAAAVTFGKKAIFHSTLKGPFLAILFIYVLMIVLPFFSAYILLIIQAFSDKAELVSQATDKLIKLFTQAASESTILAAAFIGGLLQDNNCDGISDNIQETGKYAQTKPSSNYGGVSKVEDRK